MKHRSAAGLAGLVLALLLTAPAVAAPVTVDLRIEGANAHAVRGHGHDRRTRLPLHRRPRRARLRRHRGQQRPSPTPVPTRGAALAEAAERTPFAIAGTWNAQFGATFTHGSLGENVEYDPATDRFLAEYKNGEGANFGACGDPIQTGDEVLFAYATVQRPRARALRPGDRPARRAGHRARHRRRQRQRRSPARRVGRRHHGRRRRAPRRPVRARATSAAGHQGRHASAPTACAVRDRRLPTAPAAAAALAARHDRAGRVDPRHPRRPALHAPPRAARAERQGSDDASGLWAVKIRLTRRLDGKCWYFSGSREQFLKRTCGKQHAFKVGDRAEWSYLLPARLPRGRYVLSTYAIDNAFNHGEESRVVFRVR